MNRKSFLKHSLLLATGGVVTATLPGCSLFDAAEMELCLENDIQEGETKLFTFNRKRILLRKDQGELVIFSLICSHKRCTVAYQAEEEVFECPCHEGLYDKQGNVLDGPPPAPLSRFKYDIRDGMILVLNQRV